ncbi:sugar-binding domain-containing protein [Rhodovulum kholense]|uniref:sugar-binding domain-containing protein n=1 Tax=Rhodovulum kholense TaxID=453584 RepID=UPI000D3B7E83|nr:sugar-binding domain-containing protein [Rhodovulum kholense]
MTSRALPSARLWGSAASSWRAGCRKRARPAWSTSSVPPRRDRCGFGRCIFVPAQPDDRVLQVLAEAAASCLIEHTVQSAILGVASGRSTSRVSRLILSRPRCTLVRIADVARSTSLPDNPTETVRRMAQIASGPSWRLFAPIVLSSREAAETLRREPGIATAHAFFPRLTRVLMTTAPWEPGESMIHDSIPAEDQAMVAAFHTAADVPANVIDDGVGRLRPTLPPGPCRSHSRSCARCPA